jgi:hypothetical protein
LAARENHALLLYRYAVFDGCLTILELKEEWTLKVRRRYGS